MNIHVTINYSTETNLDEVETCNRYALPWELVTVTGDYSHHYETVNGCDSLVSIHVIINHSAETNLDDAADVTNTSCLGN